MPNDDLERFEHAARRVNKKDEKIAELERELLAEKDKRKEDKFLFCLFSILVCDIALIIYGASRVGLVIVGFIEILIIALLARRYGIEGIREFIDWVISVFQRLTTSMR